MSCLIVPIFAFVVLGAAQPLVPSARLDSEGETWPAALTLDGKSLLGVLKSGDHCDVVVWDTTSKSRTFLVKGSMGLPVAVSPDRQNVAGMVLSNIEDASADAEIVIWDNAKRSTTAALLKLKKSSMPLLLWPALFYQCGLLLRLDPIRLCGRQYEEGPRLEAGGVGSMGCAEDARFSPTK